MKPSIQRLIDDLQRQIDELRRNGTGVSEVFHDSTLSGKGTRSSNLSAAALSSSIDARIGSLSGTIDARFAAMSGYVFLGSRLLTSTTSGTIQSLSSGTQAVLLRAVGGGGGGGSKFLDVTAAAGGGGASGMYIEKWITGSFSSLTYQCGAAGTPGNDTIGGTGGDTVVVLGTTTYVARGGRGGTGSLAGSAPGGQRQSLTQSVDVQFQEEGWPGVSLVSPTTMIFGGAGGSNPLGTGGGAQYGEGEGRAATGFGGGGGGMADTNGAGPAFPGGSGTQGAVEVYEFAAMVGGVISTGSAGLSTVSTDSTLSGDGTVGSPLSASPLSGTINARVVNLSGTVDGHFNALSGTLNSAIRSIALGSGTIAIASNIWDRPTNPHFLDEEFETDTLGSRWLTASLSGTFVTGVNPYDAFASGPARLDINTRRRSWMIMQPPSDGGSYGIYLTSSAQWPLPTDDFAISFRGTFMSRVAISPTNNDASIGINICPLRADGMPDRSPFSTTQNFVEMALNEADTGVHQTEFSIQESGVTKVSVVGFDYFTTVMQQPTVEMVGLAKRGNVYYGWSIGSNGSPVSHGSGTWTGSVGAIYFRVSNAGPIATQFPGNAYIAIDFIRFCSSSQFPP